MKQPKPKARITKPIREWLDVLAVNNGKVSPGLSDTLRSILLGKRHSPRVRMTATHMLAALSRETFRDVVKFTVVGGDIRLWFYDDRDAVAFALSYL